MLANTKLVSVGSFDFRLNHLLIIGILVLSFTISFLLRIQPAEFGFELNEFDPFFNYRATQYIVDNGIPAYFEWNDSLSWYPHGRDVSSTSQVMLHLTAATTYWIFGGGTDLYDFTILFPVIFASLSAIVIFALVRVIGGTTAGLFSALLFSISIPILIRSPIGWFKSEPLGLFFGLLTLYLLLSGISSQNKKIAFLKLVGAGIFTVFSISSWGGNQFFIIPIGIFFISLPFIRTDHKFIIWAIPLYTITTILVSLTLERVSSNFIFGLGGISLIIPTLFLISCIFIQHKSSKNKTRNGLLFLLVLLITASILFMINSDSQFLPTASHRYLNALNPFLTTTDPLVDSVSEHATTTIQQSFLFHSVLMIFSGLGIWLIIKNIQTKNFSIKNDMLSFSLIMGLVGVYVASTFVRLEVFASISVIILASLGLTVLTKEVFANKSTSKKLFNKLLSFPFFAGIIILLMLPMVYPVGSEPSSITHMPPTILNGGSAYGVATNDWLDALDWIKNNTPKDAVVAAWWDYGYWISTMGERASLADNSTLIDSIIKNIARIFLDNPNNAWNSLNETQADYVLIFVAGEKLNLNTPDSFYTLLGGGDESKKQWFMRIAGYDTSKYLHSDGSSGTDYFWNETLLGKMIPFNVLGYVNPNNLNQQSPTFVPGMVAIYEKDIKFTSDGDGPLRLVYASPGFTEEKIGPLIGVFIYEVNKDYKPLS
ncbi:STT3 domain-containing protein [Nitrosopumilus sp.]|uniref:STT3 domain-containing protein n=1 Tax=Nitrosopumilus sp. TaxID=2024843 RepID=UPI0034A04624